MGKFKPRRMYKPNLTDEGVHVNTLLKLLDGHNPLDLQLVEKLNLDKLENEFIAIRGAATLVKAQEDINKQFHKEDYISTLDNISIDTQDDKLKLKFENIEGSAFFETLELADIVAIPKYSTKSDFFSDLFGMDKYAKELLNNGCADILQANVSLLKSKNIAQKERKYRLLYDNKENKFYIRAIVSKDLYKDYDNNITIVVGLIALHRQMQEQGIEYSINRIEYNESYIRVYFEEQNTRELENIGYVKNLIIASNDEIKRESLKFDAGCSIIYTSTEGVDQELFIQPSLSGKSKIESNITSVRHTSSVDNFIESIIKIDESTQVHDELYQLITDISNLNNLQELKFIIRSKVRYAKNKSFKKYKEDITRVIDEFNVGNIIQLLTLFNKMDLITENDIEANEYVRYLVYECLINKK